MVEPVSLARRAVLGGAALLACWAPAASQPSSKGSAMQIAYVGCRTTRQRNARGEGIRVFQVDPGTRAWTQVQLVRGLDNPSFLAFDRERRFLYAVHGDLSEISAFRVDPETGRLMLLNRQSTQGRNPVHLVADTDNRFIILANYATGTVAVMPRLSDGSVGPVQQLEPLPGEPGPNKIDQISSHPHEVAYDRRGRFMLVPDKGLDRIFTFRFDASAGRLVPAEFVQVRPGAGPRHIVFHPTAPYAFVAHELDSSIGTYSYDAETGGLRPIQVIPSTPDSFTDANTAAEIDITPDGRFLFVSNRGHDSIGTFAIDATMGKLSPVSWTASDGKGPRFVTLDPTGQTLYAANENSDTIVPFRVDPSTGALTRVGDPVATGSPVCIVFGSVGA